MYEQIGESIDVLMMFKGGKPRPLSFRWHGRKYDVRRLNLLHVSKSGSFPIFHFSVDDGINFFKLDFHSTDLRWELAEMCTV